MFKILSLIIFIYSNFSFAQKDCYQSLGEVTKSVYGEEVELEKLDLYMGLYKKQVKDKETTEILNKNNEMLLSLEKLSKNATRVEYERIKEVHKETINLPSISKSICRPNFYDPKDQIGLCFGRAMGVHLKALQMKVPKNSVLKLWLVGDFEGAHWNHHVATIIADTNGRWYALDPLFEKPIEVKEYYQTYQKMFGQRISLLLTDPKRLLSSKSGVDRSFRGYHRKHLSYDFSSLEIYWKEFFGDLLEDLKSSKSE